MPICPVSEQDGLCGNHDPRRHGRPFPGPPGRLDVLPCQEFLAEQQDDGSILLVPVTLIPTRELALWENPDLRRSVMTGVAEADAGLIVTDSDVLRDLNASPGAGDDEEGE